MMPNSSSTDPKKMMTYPIYLDELAYRCKLPRRSDLVVLLPASEQVKRGLGLPQFLWKAKYLSIGRIIGLPGETVELANGKLRVNGQSWEEPYLVSEFSSTAALAQRHLKSREYLILPDNRHLIKERPDNYLIDRDFIMGRCALSKWPIGWWLYKPSAFLRARPIE
jgi:signal peptidase I